MEGDYEPVGNSIYSKELEQIVKVCMTPEPFKRPSIIEVKFIMIINDL